MTKNNLLLVASSFPPRQDAGVFRTLRFAKYLPQFGWNVHVLTVDPAHYEVGTARDENLLSKLPEEVTVHRTRAIYPIEWIAQAKQLVTKRPADDVARKSSPSRSNGAEKNSRGGMLQSVKDGLTVPLMTPDRYVGWLPFALRKGKAIIRQHGIQSIYSSGPPWTNHLIGLKLKRASGCKWLADFRDPWVGSDFRPQRRSDTWLGKRHRKLERSVVEAADRLVLNTPRAAEDLLQRYGGLAAEKLSVIPNGYDPGDYNDVWALEGAGKTSPSHSGRMVITHAGAFYGKRNVEGLIRAIGQACRRGSLSREQIEVRLIGALRSGRTTELNQTLEEGVSEIVRLSPAVPHAECLKELSAADVLLLVQTSAPLCVPGKLFEYLALGKPVLALANEGATADLVQREGVGIVVSPDDVCAIERAITDLHRAFVAGNLPAVPSESRGRYDGIRLTEDLSLTLSDMLAR